MIRFGITTRDQLPADFPLSKRPPALSLTLLGEFDEHLSERDEQAIEAICDAIPTGRDLENRSRTFPQRYDAVDNLILDEIDKNFDSSQPIRIHDVAASNAITSLDLFEKVKNRGNASVHATDFLNEIYVVSVPGSRWLTIFDAEKRPLQYVGKRFVLSATRKESTRFLINLLIQKALQTFILPRAQQIVTSGSAPSANRVKRIATFHPRTIALANRDPRFTLGRYDMFEPTSDRYEVIRVMSAFSFISREKVERAVEAMCSSLVEGGLLVVGRHRGRGIDETPTTVFQRRGRRLLPRRDLSGGADERETVLAVELVADAPAGGTTVAR